MPGASVVLRNALANETLRGVQWAPPAKVYASLHSGDPKQTGAHYISGTGRKQVRFGAPVLVAATEELAAHTRARNAYSVRWDSMPAATVTHLCLWSAATGGQLLFVMELVDPTALTAGQGLFFAVGKIEVRWE